MKFIYFSAAFLMCFFITGCQETAYKSQEDSKRFSSGHEESGTPGQQNDSAAFRDTAVKVGKDELQQFLTIQPRIDSLIQESKVVMMKTLEKGNLDIERFNEVRMVAEDPSTNNDVSRADLENFKTVYKELEEIKRETDKNIAESLEQAGLTKERYEEISDALKTNPGLKELVQGEKG